jgi:HlyD family secretion protein
MRRFLRFLPVLLILAIGGGVAGYLRSKPREIEVVVPVEKTVVESIAASGRLRGQVETSVGAQTSGRVMQLLVREGDKVRNAQVIARLDDAVLAAQVSQSQSAITTAQATLSQAEDAVGSARASLAVASRPPLASDVARLRADVNQNVAVAKARLAGARQKLQAASRRLAELKKGPREEEIDSAKALAMQATASEDQAKREQDRQKTLLAEGAVAQSAADNAATAYWVARRARESADARLRQLTAGTRPEQLDQARADLRAAESEVQAAQATVTGAQASGNAQLRSLLSTPRPEDVALARTRLSEAVRARDVARSRLTEAQQALGVSRQRVGDATVRAPFDGTVTRIVTEVGGVTGPGTPLVQLVRTTTPEIRIDLDEANLGKVAVGQEAVVTCEAFPGEKFTATVREIGAQVDTDRGTVEVRLRPNAAPKWLRPGQTLSVNIIVDKGSKRLVVPLLSVNTVGGLSSILVVEDGRVGKRAVKVGSPGPGGIPILEGLKPDDLVVANPAGIAIDSAATPKKIVPSPGPK